MLVEDQRLEELKRCMKEYLSMSDNDAFGLELSFSDVRLVLDALENSTVAEASTKDSICNLVVLGYTVKDLILIAEACKESGKPVAQIVDGIEEGWKMCEQHFTIAIKRMFEKTEL